MATTSTSLVSSANPVAPKKSLTYTATVAGQYGGSTSGTITFKDGSASNTVPLSGGKAVLTESYPAVGTHSVTATYSGDTSNLGSTSNALTEYVENLPVTTKTVVTTSGSPSVLGQTVTFTGTVTCAYGLIPDGETVTFYDGSSILGTGQTARGVATFSTSALSAKTHTIKGTYAGDATFKTSFGTVQQVVNPYPTFTALSSSPNPSFYGQSLLLIATVTSSGPNVPTGTVTFYAGTTSLGSATLDGTGKAGANATQVPVGSNSLTALYNGDSSNGKSTSPVTTQVVNQASITIGLASSPNPSKIGQSVKFTATLGSNGGIPNGQNVAFTFNGSNLGTATIVTGKATFSTGTLPSGSDVVTATYAGDGDYGAASASVTQTVQ